MRILIIGNIGSGKTTLAKFLQRNLPIKFKFYPIDLIRKKILIKNKVSLSYLSLFYMLKKIEEEPNAIFEFTGVGCHKYAFKQALKLTNDTVLIIICRENLDVIKKRLNKKKYEYANVFNTNIYEHIYFVEAELIKDIKLKFWETDQWHTLITNCKKENFANILKFISKFIKTNISL